MDTSVSSEVISDTGAALCEVDALNALLRGEVAATEAYDMVLERVDKPAQVIELQKIRDDHFEAAAVLRERVRHFGGDPSEGSGAWGTLISVITGTAKAIGPATALGILKQGEEYGMGQYESTLADPRVHLNDKDLIRFRLLPRCQRHADELTSLISKLTA